MDLSGCKTGGDIVGFTDEFVNLETLDLSNSAITSLRAFPKLASLKKVDLSGNRLGKGLENLAACTALNHIIITGNRLKDVESMEPLKTLHSLTHLEVGCNLGNVSNEEYRQKMFEMLPSLQYLDQEDIDGNDEEEEEEHVNGHNGVTEEDDDIDDGDDELEDEEAEVDDDEEDSEGEEVTSGLGTLYHNPVLGEEDYEEEEATDEDDDVEDSEEEEQESTRGKRSPTEGGKAGKKRKLEPEVEEPDGQPEDL